MLTTHHNQYKVTSKDDSAKQAVSPFSRKIVGTMSLADAVAANEL